MLQVARGV